MHYKEYIRPICFVLASFFILFLVIKTFVLDNPVFDMTKKEGQSYTWEAYLKDRNKRNILKMRRSYAELMSLARTHLDEADLPKAQSAFFQAKTLFPEHIEPRKNLCYIYLLECRNNSLACDYAKREIYFALKYVAERDTKNRQYLTNLARMADMEDIINLPEGEALAAIF